MRDAPCDSSRVGVIISLGLTVLAALLFWLVDHLSRETLWRAKLVCLITLELSYGVIAVVFGLLSPLLWLFLYRARKQPHRRLAYARGLSLCVSVLLGLVLAEGAAAIWWKRIHRWSALPIGGWRQVAWNEKSPKLPDAPEQLKLPAGLP